MQNVQHIPYHMVGSSCSTLWNPHILLMKTSRFTKLRHPATSALRTALPSNLSSRQGLIGKDGCCFVKKEFCVYQNPKDYDHLSLFSNSGRNADASVRKMTSVNIIGLFHRTLWMGLRIFKNIKNIRSIKNIKMTKIFFFF